VATLRSVVLGCVLALLAPVARSPAAEASVQEANKALVLQYYRDLEATVAAGKIAELDKVHARYRAPGYIQHSVIAETGGPPPKMSAPKLLAIMAEGDKVIQVTSRSMTGADGVAREVVIFILFRVANGKLIEHWDAFSTPAR
jgi:predicted SnoaL-like aldol condensation-catalyzing enzyme